MPALLTHTSHMPNASSAASTCASSETFAASGTAFVIAAAVARVASRSRSSTPTR